MSDPATPTDLAAYWQQRIDQWKDSGLSQPKFCQANDLTITGLCIGAVSLNVARVVTRESARVAVSPLSIIALTSITG